MNADIDALNVHNKDLERLLGVKGPPNSNGPWKQPTPTLDFPHEDCSHVVDVYNAICDAYRCNCDNAHYANLELPQVPGSNSKLHRAMSSVDQRRLQLLFPFEDSVSDNIVGDIPENLPEEVDPDEKTLVDHEEYSKLVSLQFLELSNVDEQTQYSTSIRKNDNFTSDTAPQSLPIGHQHRF